MSNLSEPAAKYPIPEPDRRTRVHSRPHPSDRRHAQRFHSNFPVQIFVGNGDGTHVFTASAHDISDGGLLLQGVDLPESAHHIRVRFEVPDGVMPEEFEHGSYTMETEVRRRDAEHHTVGVEFAEPVALHLARTTWRHLRQLAVVGLFLAASAILLLKLENFYYFWFDVPIFLYSLAVGAFLVTRFLFAAFHRPPKPMADADLPTVSVIIPARNEQEFIGRTLRAALDQAYPAEKLQVVAVNDGSRDRTLEVMHELRLKFPELVVVSFEASRGKREALATGARLAKGDILVFVDSDSFLAPDAVRNLVDGFADPKVVAMTGHCEVENIWANFLTRMQTVRYFISFRVMKAAESVFDLVTCLSGPIAAYRRSFFTDVADEWLAQKFLGAPATFGDDRALTNYALERGHIVRYDPRAKATTIVPESFRAFWRQQLRWKRSWFRESLRACGYMWKMPPLASISFYLGFLLPMLAPAVVLRAIVYVPVVQHGSPLSYIGGIFLMSCLMCATYLWAKRSRLWIYGIPFCFMYMFALVWQLPWAVATFWKPQWRSRE